MYLVEKVRNILRGLLQTHGTETVKRSLWNKEFKEGRWSSLENTLGDCLYPYIEKYARNGTILDLGCGSGNTGNELDANAYRQYTGVDISDVAIEKARRRTEENRRTDKNNYFQSDILSFVPTQQYDVILLREAIYYVPRAQIGRLLDRYSKYLKVGGVFIVRMWNTTGKDKTIVDTIESNAEVLEKYLSDQTTTAVIVLRRGCRKRAAASG
jgi:SAM-dependent methyltransferase